MHPIQTKLLRLSKDINLGELSLRKIARLIDEKYPESIKHHLNQLIKKGFLKGSLESDKIEIVKRGKIDDSNLINIPILGGANCGEANIFADQCLQGYLKASKKIINISGNKDRKIFAIKASGNSMNKANIKGNNIEDGDYVIIDANKKNPQAGDYVLSIIDETANIKKFFIDKNKKQIALLSESTEKYAPIFIHPDDKFIINGIVKSIIKKPKVDWA